MVKAVSDRGIDGAGKKKQPESRVVFGLIIKFLLFAFHPLTLLLIGGRLSGILFCYLGFRPDSCWKFLEECYD